VSVTRVSHRFLVIVAVVTTAAAFFLLGDFHARTNDAAERAAYDAKLDSLRAEMRSQLGRTRALDVLSAGTMGSGVAGVPSVDGPSSTPDALRAQMIADIKRELQSEMGLLPVALLRDRRTSFAELYTTDNLGKTSYGTAGYLGDGYFITVKHAVVALKDDERPSTRRITSIKVLYEGREVPAKLIDSGDADVEVHTGDWAIIRTKPLDLPALRPNTTYAYDFAEPIFRLGNDYSKGIILSTGYVGQRMANGLVSCLTDGHPGVSGGGVLDQRGDLVGIPVGRMQGDYRFSFILPLRAEMFRKITPRT
jgi:trypsin-like peptidase